MTASRMRRTARQQLEPATSLSYASFPSMKLDGPRSKARHGGARVDLGQRDSICGKRPDILLKTFGCVFVSILR